ncbi:GNAT family N-acetyltransferase [Actinokineospora guangxiensis]|uniref:GNAT family N-acetyltransferase n=1 Tax=Actinokineospora guangxiensis TaxID=1490288 RepID=A0ABW0ETY6_9PSEU
MRIEIRRYEHPDSAALIAEVQQEYVVRYGSPDDSPVDPAEFAPPLGLFLVGYADLGGGETPVATGGWRSHGEKAEIKRMFVVTRARGRGYARQMLAEIETTAAAAGHRCLILETGRNQPEAIALYRDSGYTDIPAYGYYAESPLSVHLGKALEVAADLANPRLPG